ncbi:SEC10/PgrA surface exclusion domain-containing protein [Nicoliella lavandulae]|uniref:SEC10/PgrA surface exclusion domain-containing protein n=1 Tax=Nicoliella lavandulae TaxID=3082954 RepID=A0ABU8SNS0_9LACO
MISGTTINSYVSADSNKSINSQIKKFKQQTTDDATIATKKSISKLGNNSLNYFIPTQARKIKGNSIQDPGSDANFVTKVNYSARNNPQNRINLPKGYSIALLKKAAQKNSWKNTKLQIKIGRIGLQGLAMNSFTPSKRDLSRIVNLNHVTQAQNVELNNFTLSLINPIIKKLGGIQYLSSYNAVKAAQNVADVYSQDNWNNTGSKVGHDSRFRRVVGSKFNIKDVAEENYTDNPALGLTEIKLKNRDVSMAALKHAIYNSVALQLFEDGPSYWGHATALMNLDIHKKYQPNYFGTSFDKFGGLHFFMIPHNKKVNVDFKPF